MNENYIHIYTSYISEVFQQNKLSVEDIYKLLSEFEKICEKVHSRQELVAFMDPLVVKYLPLQELKNRLLDQGYVFPEAPVDEE